MKSLLFKKNLKRIYSSILIFYLVGQIFFPTAHAGKSLGPAIEAYHDDYLTEGEIPEPLVYDLVRRLGADKGEFEINSLFRIEESTKTGDILHAPELEYAIFDGIAVELELPFRGSTLESLKGAIQFTHGRFGSRHQFIHGSQYLYENYLNGSEGHLISTYILGHRISHLLSYLAIVGPSINWTQTGSADVSAVANFTLFYNSSREVDLGLEINWTGPQVEHRSLRIMPQLHLLFPDDWKVQTGMGIISHVSNDFEFTSALRIIKEFN